MASENRNHNHGGTSADTAIAESKQKNTDVDETKEQDYWLTDEWRLGMCEELLRTDSTLIHQLLIASIKIRLDTYIRRQKAREDILQSRVAMQYLFVILFFHLNGQRSCSSLQIHHLLSSSLQYLTFCDRRSKDKPILQSLLSRDLSIVYAMLDSDDQNILQYVKQTFVIQSVLYQTYIYLAFEHLQVCCRLFRDIVYNDEKSMRYYLNHLGDSLLCRDNFKM
ncbi:hypothetical protein RFI_32221 [Reticulomyxa filosa]|uniref:Uncharacterized protein n=1 Tax=Reticulomyxa filosa TaxID=46433 RepID=X6LWR6_RETFI|nr:hypothetical protein RFI_32221 [Reticulomyxa filosa]|eukprot:ETO05175.1 hypothetical protein RFI_32221 [Reticulomyxa filosa]